jgi:RNA polymerase subunit RPABC4/transcription elongation factor Spt4
VRLFKRKQPVGSPCPRCSQLVADNRDECPMCGWDVRETYQGPTFSLHPDMTEEVVVEPREG